MTYAHILDERGEVVACSAAVDMMHYYDPSEPEYQLCGDKGDYTGLGFCPHSGADMTVVPVPFPALTGGNQTLFIDFTDAA